jgi:hypothetical protein
MAVTVMEKNMRSDHLILRAGGRGSLWLMIAGAPMGAAYGVLLLLLMFAQSSGRTVNDLPGICGIGFVIGIIGGLIGGVLGVVVGLLDGLSIGLLTQAGYLPDPSSDAYIRSVRIASMLISPLGVLLVFAIVTSSLAAGLLWFSAVPMLGAALGGWWAGEHIAEW